MTTRKIPPPGTTKLPRTIFNLENQRALLAEHEPRTLLNEPRPSRHDEQQLTDAVRLAEDATGERARQEITLQISAVTAALDIIHTAIRKQHPVDRGLLRTIDRSRRALHKNVSDA